MTASRRVGSRFFGLYVCLLAICGLPAAADNPSFDELVAMLEKQPPPLVRHFAGGTGTGQYTVFVNNAAIAPLLRNSYTKGDIARLAAATEAIRRIDVTRREWGTFIQAASFASDDMGEATNYDAIWVRDSVWGYLALRADPAGAGAARDVLLTLWDYMATAAQRDRMAAAIRDPAVLAAGDGQMRAVHIRFNSASPSFADVEENGKPQPWTHKQNDALGLLLAATIAGLADGFVTVDDLAKNGRLDAMAHLFAYLEAIRFHAMEDSGAWEEAARLNTSSVALVTASFESLRDALEEDGSPFATAFAESADKLGLGRIADAATLDAVIGHGYARVGKQLALGGESPDYPPGDSRYRRSDAALLNLIYPAVLKRFGVGEKRVAMEQVGPLVGDYGIRRYFDDDYQAANFWFHDIKTDTDAKSMEERKKNFLAGSEAQWFFDSWYAKAWLLLYKESGDEADLSRAAMHANRALAQITGRRDGKPVRGADGRPAAEPQLPESYNYIVSDGGMYPAPSPINPLNWAKASLTLMLREFASVAPE